MRIRRIYIDSDVSTTKTVTFDLREDCLTEVLIADLWVIGADVKTATVSSGAETGDLKGEEVSMNLDFAGVDPGFYSLVIRTAETGLLAKTTVTIK